MSARGTEIHAACSVVFAAGVPSFRWQSGEFTGAITDTGVGNITLNFNAANGVDITESAWSLTARQAGAQIEFNVVVTSDIAVQVVTWDEGGGPAAVADVDFDAICYRLVII